MRGAEVGEDKVLELSIRRDDAEGDFRGGLIEVLEADEDVGGGGAGVLEHRA